MKTKEKKGISLIVLVIIIIVIIILATAILVNLLNGNVIGNASKARVESDIDSFKSELVLYVGDKSVEYQKEGKTFIPSNFSADEEKVIYNGIKEEGKTIYNVLPELEGTDYEGTIEVIDGELKYVENDENNVNNNVKEMLKENLGEKTTLDGKVMTKDMYEFEKLFKEKQEEVEEENRLLINRGYITNLKENKTVSDLLEALPEGCTLKKWMEKTLVVQTLYIQLEHKYIIMGS